MRRLSTPLPPFCHLGRDPFLDPFSISFLVWGLSCRILALSKRTLDVEPKLTSKMYLFMTHFQRVKSCESVVNSVQIAFLRVPKKSIDLGSILTPILDPYWHQKCSLYSKRTTLAPKSSIRKWSWKNSHSWRVLPGGGERHRTPETEGWSTHFGCHF